jgi:hypothetical protein
VQIEISIDVPKSFDDGAFAKGGKGIAAKSVGSDFSVLDIAQCLATAIELSGLRMTTILLAQTALVLRSRGALDWIDEPEEFPLAKAYREFVDAAERIDEAIDNLSDERDIADEHTP